MPVNLQQDMLESEGIEFSEKGKCDLKKYLWYPLGRQHEEEIQPSLLR
jgi:hypothetical protein